MNRSSIVFNSPIWALVQQWIHTAINLIRPNPKPLTVEAYIQAIAVEAGLVHPMTQQKDLSVQHSQQLKQLTHWAMELEAVSAHQDPETLPELLAETNSFYELLPTVCDEWYVCLATRVTRHLFQALMHLGDHEAAYRCQKQWTRWMFEQPVALVHPVVRQTMIQQSLELAEALAAHGQSLLVEVQYRRLLQLMMDSGIIDELLAKSFVRCGLTLIHALGETAEGLEQGELVYVELQAYSLYLLNYQGIPDTLINAAAVLCRQAAEHDDVIRIERYWLELWTGLEGYGVPSNGHTDIGHALAAVLPYLTLTQTKRLMRALTIKQQAPMAVWESLIASLYENEKATLNRITLAQLKVIEVSLQKGSPDGSLSSDLTAGLQLLWIHRSLSTKQLLQLHHSILNNPLPTNAETFNQEAELLYELTERWHEISNSEPLQAIYDRLKRGNTHAPKHEGLAVALSLCINRRLNSLTLDSPAFEEAFQLFQKLVPQHAHHSEVLLHYSRSCADLIQRLINERDRGLFDQAKHCLEGLAVFRSEQFEGETAHHLEILRAEWLIFQARLHYEESEEIIFKAYQDLRLHAHPFEGDPFASHIKEKACLALLRQAHKSARLSLAYESWLPLLITHVEQESYTRESVKQGLCYAIEATINSHNVALVTHWVHQLLHLSLDTPDEGCERLHTTCQALWQSGQKAYQRLAITLAERTSVTLHDTVVTWPINDPHITPPSHRLSTSSREAVLVYSNEGTDSDQHIAIAYQQLRKRKATQNKAS